MSAQVPDTLEDLAPSAPVTLPGPGEHDPLLALPLPRIQGPWLHRATTENDVAPSPSCVAILQDVIGTPNAEQFLSAVVDATHHPLAPVSPANRPAVRVLLGISKGEGSTKEGPRGHNNVASAVHAALLPALLLDQILFALDLNPAPVDPMPRAIQRPETNKEIAKLLSKYPTTEDVIKEVKSGHERAKEHADSVMARARAQVQAGSGVAVDAKLKEALHLLNSFSAARVPGSVRMQNLFSAVFLLSYYIRGYHDLNDLERLQGHAAWYLRKVGRPVTPGDVKAQLNKAGRQISSALTVALIFTPLLLMSDTNALHRPAFSQGMVLLKYWHANGSEDRLRSSSIGFRCAEQTLWRLMLLSARGDFWPGDIPTMVMSDRDFLPFVNASPRIAMSFASDAVPPNPSVGRPGKRALDPPDEVEGEPRLKVPRMDPEFLDDLIRMDDEEEEIPWVAPSCSSASGGEPWTSFLLTSVSEMPDGENERLQPTARPSSPLTSGGASEKPDGANERPPPTAGASSPKTIDGASEKPDGANERPPPLNPSNKKCSGEDKPRRMSSPLTSDAESDRSVGEDKGKGGKPRRKPSLPTGDMEGENKGKGGKGKGRVLGNDGGSGAGTPSARVLRERKVVTDDAKPPKQTYSYTGSSRKSGKRRPEPLVNTFTAEPRPREIDRLHAGSRVKPKELDLGAVHKLTETPLKIGLTVPMLKRDGTHGSKYVVFNWSYFADQPWAAALVKKMLETQVYRDGVPLVAHESSWNADLSIRPSETQSGVLNISLNDWMALKGEQQRELNRWRVITIHGTYYITKFDFGLPSMRLFRDPFAVCEIQDMSQLTTTDEPVLRDGKLIDLLPDAAYAKVAPERAKKRRQQRPLNAIQHPLHLRNAPVPPAWEHCSTNEFAVMHTEYLQGTGRYNAEDSRLKTNWGLVGNKHTFTGRHTDGMGTAAIPQCGIKAWAVGVRKQLNSNGPGDWGCRHALTGWDPLRAGEEYLRWEFILHEHGTILIMPVGWEHFVLHLSDTMGTGIHRHSVAELTPAIEMILHIAISEGWSTNAEYNVPGWLLVRIFIFQASRLTEGALLEKEDQDHVVDLSTADGLHSLVMLVAYMALYPAIHGTPPTSRPDPNSIFGKPPTLQDETWRDLQLAWRMAGTLMEFLDEQTEVTPATLGGETPAASVSDGTFTTLVSEAVVNMALCLDAYKHEWYTSHRELYPILPEDIEEGHEHEREDENDDEAEDQGDVKGPDYSKTPVCFRQQLARALAGFWETTAEGAIKDFRGVWAKHSNMRSACKSFLDRAQSGENVDRFMPWVLIPFVLRRRL